MTEFSYYLSFGPSETLRSSFTSITLFRRYTQQTFTDEIHCGTNIHIHENNVQTLSKEGWNTHGFSNDASSSRFSSETRQSLQTEVDASDVWRSLCICLTECIWMNCVLRTRVVWCYWGLTLSPTGPPGPCRPLSPREPFSDSANKRMNGRKKTAPKITPFPTTHNRVYVSIK